MGMDFGDMPENLEKGLSNLPNKKNLMPFVGTPEQEEQLNTTLAEIKDQKGALMSALQKAQNIYGYLPIEVQKMVAKGLDLRLDKVYGVVTFYSQFSLNPKGKYKVSVCLGTACYVKNAQAIMDKLEQELEIAGGECTPDMKFSLEACRCIGACGLAPLIAVNDDVYGRLSIDDIPGIIKKYKEMD
jgi:NADP-reducing hydrogenase subunit HndA